MGVQAAKVSEDNRVRRLNPAPWLAGQWDSAGNPTLAWYDGDYRFFRYGVQANYIVFQWLKSKYDLTGFGIRITRTDSAASTKYLEIVTVENNNSTARYRVALTAV